MSRLLLVTGVATLAFASPVAAQSMPGMDMHGGMAGMKMAPAPAKAKTKRKPRAAGVKSPASRASAPRRAAPTGHVAAAGPHAGRMEGMDMSGAASMQGMSMPKSREGSQSQAEPSSMQGMAMPSGHPMAGMATPAAPSGTDLTPGTAPAPTPPHNHYADRTYGTAAMEHGRREMTHDEGGRTYHQILLNLAELQIRDGKDGYRWDGEAWIGGDVDRLWLKSEGEGTFRQGVDGAEAQALYGHAVGPYFNLQAGVRHDFAPSPTRTYATVGVEGLAPYGFETEGALFVSTEGDLLGRLEGWYDERVTQRLVFQPRAELNLSAQDLRENRLGSGLTDAELGLRLRYEISREFAPYVGVSWERRFGDTARFARADGESTGGFSLVGGIRFWF